MKKAIVFVTLVCVLCLAGCGQIIPLGTSAPDITPNRGSNLTGNVTQKDMSGAAAFMAALNATLDDPLTDYTLTYDPDTHTAYAADAGRTVALKLDNDGNVIMASAAGMADAKESLSRGIAEVFIGTGKANEVKQLFDKIEETRWLNSINASVAIKEAEGFSLEPLDTTLMDATLPNIAELDTTLTMPTLTAQLESAGLQDLTNYFESPSLPSLWTEADIDSVMGDIADIEKNGQSLKDIYEGYTVPSPDMPVEKWTIDEFELPSSYGDGTPTQSGQAVADAYKKFNDSLKAWKNEISLTQSGSTSADDTAGEETGT